MRATLEKVLTQQAFDRMIPLAERWTEGVERAIAEFDLPGMSAASVAGRISFLAHSPAQRQRGSRCYGLRTGAFHAFVRHESRHLLTPFHNMALMSPVTKQEDIDQHTKIFCEALRALVS